MSAEQIELYEEFQKLGPIDRSQPPGDHTGERLKRDRPDVYELCVRMLADPRVTLRTICRELHISAHTVMAVRELEQVSIKDHAQVLGRKLAFATHVFIDQAMEDAPNMSGKDAMIAAGIANQNYQLITGGATARLETTARVDFGAELQKLAAQAEAMLAMKRANVIEVTATALPAGDGETFNVQRSTSNVQLEAESSSV